MRRAIPAFAILLWPTMSTAADERSGDAPEPEAYYNTFDLAFQLLYVIRGVGVRRDLATSFQIADMDQEITMLRPHMSDYGKAFEGEESDQRIQEMATTEACARMAGDGYRKLVRGAVSDARSLLE